MATPLDTSRARLLAVVASSGDDVDDPHVTPADSDRTDQWDEAVALAFTQAGRHLLTKEANAAKQAAKNPSRFLAWLDEFYDKHADFALRELSAACSCAYAAGYKLDRAACDAMVAKHIQASREALLSAAECPADKLLASVEATVATWPTERAERMGRELLGGVS